MSIDFSKVPTKKMFAHNLPEGICHVYVPDILSRDSVEEVGDWLEIVLRSIQRSKTSAAEPRYQHEDDKRRVECKDLLCSWVI